MKALADDGKQEMVVTTWDKADLDRSIQMYIRRDLGDTVLKEVRRQISEMQTQPAIAKKMLLDALSTARTMENIDQAPYLSGTLRSVAILLGATKEELRAS